VCVDKAEECPRDGVDCSGTTEYAICFVNALYEVAGVAARGIVGNAADQAHFFQTRGALISRSGSPSPGDLVFFDDGKTSKITHVGIVLGKTADDELLIIHSTGPRTRPAGRPVGGVEFCRLSKVEKLRSRIAGFGDLSVFVSR
jgi:hypothetical protein